jgi:hypothetical protein
MRRAFIGATVLIALLALSVGLGSGTAAAGNKKLVEGTVYDATCVTVCTPPCPPPCGGPIPAPKSQGAAICAQASIVCPLSRIASPYPVYPGEGSLVNVRKRGSSTVLARLPIVEGHFKIRLAPGDYVFHPYLSEEQCWSATPATAQVTPRSKSPVPVTLSATDRCVVHSS